MADEVKFDPELRKRYSKVRPIIKGLQQKELLPDKYSKRIAFIVAEEQQKTIDSKQEELKQSEQKRQEAEERSRIDSLTGLPNRPAFEERLRYEIERSKRDKKPVALMMFDIDHFKEVNDELGHDAGDEVLKDVGSYFKGERNESNGKPLKRAIDFVARFGGDEFQIISPEMEDEKGEEFLAERIRVGLQKKLSNVPLKNNVKPTVSIGIAFYHPFTKGETADEALQRVLKEADVAMYQAKAQGKNRVVVYSPNMQ